MIVRPYEDNNKRRVIQLVAEFRVAFAQLKSLDRYLDSKAAREELDEYQEKQNPVFVAESDGQIVGQVEKYEFDYHFSIG